MEINYDKENSVELIKLVLIYARNNTNDFFKSRLIKQTSYKHYELDNLTNNYIFNNELSLKESK
nr:hypothetical protein [uncultured Mediterranean phage uvMED]